MSKPWFDPIALRCAACGNRWSDWIAVHAPFAIVLACMQHIVNVGCPRCGCQKRGAVLWDHAGKSPPETA